MYLTNETAQAHQQTMLAEAAEQRQALRVRALGRATRSAERAQRRLVHAQQDAVRLRAELAAGRKS
jgi:hypothetical protein